MTIYTTVCSPKGAKVAKIQDDGISLYEYFVGYDFMGSVDWTTNSNDAALMNLEQAERVVEDLETADD